MITDNTENVAKAAKIDTPDPAETSWIAGTDDKNTVAANWTGSDDAQGQSWIMDLGCLRHMGRLSWTLWQYHQRMPCPTSPLQTPELKESVTPLSTVCQERLDPQRYLAAVLGVVSCSRGGLPGHFYGRLLPQDVGLCYSYEGATTSSLTDFRVRVELETSRKIKIVRCDNGGEYKPLEGELGSIQGIKFEFATPQYRLYNPAKDRIIFSAAPRFVEEERLDLPDDTLGDDSGTVVFNPMEADFPEELTSSTINHKDRRTRAPVGGAGDAGNDILGNDSGSHVILRWIPGAIRDDGGHYVAERNPEGIGVRDAESPPHQSTSPSPPLAPSVGEDRDSGPRKSSRRQRWYQEKTLQLKSLAARSAVDSGCLERARAASVSRGLGAGEGSEKERDFLVAAGYPTSSKPRLGCLIVSRIDLSLKGSVKFWRRLSGDALANDPDRLPPTPVSNWCLRRSGNPTDRRPLRSYTAHVLRLRKSLYGLKQSGMECLRLGQLSQICSKPTIRSWDGFIHVLRYLKRSRGLRPSFGGTGGNMPWLRGYSDSDYAGDHINRHSVSGYTFMLNEGIEAGKKSQWLRGLLQETNSKMLGNRGNVVQLSGDNQTSLAVVDDPMFHWPRTLGKAVGCPPEDES
ncbi:hypothetical protein V502_06615 [Pseudogymnoascus sp. VKM F-4520 (FW-2644)]|nr:hypothetical protein V502_06615 [Pseudogymnoascus sp. VKM F-4520 (FW-2644)]